MKRATKYEINSIVTTILVLAITVFVMLISYKHSHRFDLTKNKKHSLAEQTVNIMKKLDVKINAVAFYSKGFPKEDQAKDLLEQYHYTNPRFSFEIVDPDKRPDKAKMYDITSAGTIVIECGDNKEKVRDATEEAITNAIVKVSRPGKKKIYFITGHNELSVEDRENRDISLFKDSLEKEVYEVKTLDFGRENKVPMDAAVLIVAGPERPFEKKELELLKNYINEGGRVFFLLGMSSPKDLNTFLAQFGFKINEDVVIDEVSQLFGGNAAIPAILPPDGYGSHKIVEKFRLRCFFPLTRSIQIEEKKPEGSTLNELAFASPAAYAETNLEMMKKGKYKFDKNVDRTGRMCIAVTGTYPSPKKSESPEKEKEPKGKEGRIVVWGSSLAITNAIINYGGNKDFALNSVGWLSEEENLISIRPRDEKTSPISIDSVSMLKVLFGLILMPAFIIFLGIWMKVRRK